jgi:hypothetical protein
MLTPFDASLGAGRCRGARLLEVTRAKAAEAAIEPARQSKDVLLRIEDAARGQRVRPH